jgi:hypothetical protein
LIKGERSSGEINTIHKDCNESNDLIDSGDISDSSDSCDSSDSSDGNDSIADAFERYYGNLKILTILIFYFR